MKNEHIQNTLVNLERSQESKSKYSFNVEGRDFVVYPGVFSPKYFKSTEFCLDSVKFKEGDKILEIGCGVGIFSIFAALNGASKVVAIDINENAVANTKENAEINGVSDKVFCLKSNVYSELNEDEKFDVIFWNVPFLYYEGEVNMLERSVIDPKYKSIEKFVINAKNYLKKEGRLLLEFSSDLGDMDKMQKIFDESEMNVKLVCRKEMDYKNEVGKVNLELFELTLSK